MPIQLKEVSYTYSKKSYFSHQGIRDVNLDIQDGEWIAVMGTTGSGKSTLLQHLNGLLKPDTGEVTFRGINIHSSPKILRQVRREVGLVFQYPEHQLFGTTVFEEIAYGPENYGIKDNIKVERKVKDAMAAVGLDYNRYKERSPHQLSGGEKRRVALAGVLAVQPRVIALDEPTAGLDYEGKAMLIENITKLNRESGITVIWVTHEVAEIADLADRLVVLDKGTLIFNGQVREVLAEPLLLKLGIEVPFAVEVAHSLKDRGWHLTGIPLNLREIKADILRLKG
jgi:energy-coupling factor transport system ATP-binding protein